MTGQPTRRQMLRWTATGTGVAALRGVPGTAAGQSASVTAQPAANELRITTVGEPSQYVLEVRNELIRKAEYPGRPEEEVQTTNEGNSRVHEAVVPSGEDIYYFDGELDVVQFAAEPQLVATIDGVEIHLGGDVDVHTLTLGSLSEAFISYELEVERELSRSDALVIKTFGDTVDGNVARGSVTDIDARLPRKRHTYTYQGELIRFTTTGDAGVYLDGRRVRPGEFVERHTLTIDGTDDGTRDQATTYEFEVEADLEKRALFGSVINEGDTVDGMEADGAVVNGRDSYEYTGDLLRFNSFGDAQVLLDGSVVDLTPSRLTLTGSGDPAAYDLEVRNDLPGVAPGIAPGLRKIPFASTEPADTVDGTEAIGVVVSGTDAYEFTGDLRRFTTDGEADVELDGEAIRPRDIVTEHTVTYSDRVGGPTEFAAKKYKLAIEPDGTLRRDDALNAKTTPNESDEEIGALRENFVKGAVPGNRDSYVFTGEVTWAVAGDSVRIILDGEDVTAEELAKQ